MIVYDLTGFYNKLKHKLIFIITTLKLLIILWRCSSFVALFPSEVFSFFLPLSSPFLKRGILKVRDSALVSRQSSRACTAIQRKFYILSSVISKLK